MNRGTVLNLPFLGQIVKVITRDGKEYEMKISEEIPENPYVFSLMYKLKDETVSSVPKPFNPNRPPPPPPHLLNKDKVSNVSGTSSNKTEKEKAKDIKNDNKEDKKTKKKGILDIGKILIK